MSDREPTNSDETGPANSESNSTTGSWVAGVSDAAGGAALPPPITFSPNWSATSPVANKQRLSRARRWPSSRRRGRFVAAVVMAAVIGLSVGLTTSHSASAQQLVSANHSSGRTGFGGGGANARSGPAAGGASGTVGAVSKSSFTMTTSAGQSVTVDETTSTKYLKKTSSISASAIKKGEPVLVLGTVSGTTIKATQVIVQGTGGSRSAASSAAGVVPFKQGAPTTSKQVGQIPANWSQGSGTIVSGTAATKATEAALAAYPGGIVDRVVKLSNGEYNVHIIGVNWPHHVFVNQNFKVVGAL